MLRVQTLARDDHGVAIRVQLHPECATLPTISHVLAQETKNALLDDNGIKHADRVAELLSDHLACQVTLACTCSNIQKQQHQHDHMCAAYELNTDLIAATSWQHVPKSIRSVQHTDAKLPIQQSPAVASVFDTKDMKTLQQLMTTTADAKTSTTTGHTCIARAIQLVHERPSALFSECFATTCTLSRLSVLPKWKQIAPIIRSAFDVTVSNVEQQVIKTCGSNERRRVVMAHLGVGMLFSEWLQLLRYVSADSRTDDGSTLHIELVWISDMRDFAHDLLDERYNPDANQGVVDAMRMRSGQPLTDHTKRLESIQLQILRIAMFLKWFEHTNVRIQGIHLYSSVDDFARLSSPLIRFDTLRAWDCWDDGLHPSHILPLVTYLDPVHGTVALACSSRAFSVASPCLEMWSSICLRAHPLPFLQRCTRRWLYRQPLFSTNIDLQHDAQFQSLSPEMQKRTQDALVQLQRMHHTVALHHPLSHKWIIAFISECIAIPRTLQRRLLLLVAVLALMFAFAVKLLWFR